jgi:hypothetical protein
MAHKFLPDDQYNRPTMSESTSRVPHYCISKMAGPSDVGTTRATPLGIKTQKDRFHLRETYSSGTCPFLYYKEY